MKDNKKNILSDLDKIISIYEQYMLELIENDPELPILPIVHREIMECEVDEIWTGSFGEANITEYIIMDKRVFFKDEEDPLWLLNEFIDDIDYCEQTYDVVEKEYNNLPWIKAIVVNIDTFKG